MNIINKEDPRYNKLTGLWRRVDYSNSIEKLSKKNWYYLVPKELHLEMSEDKYIPTRFMRKYLDKHCGLSLKQYYLLMNKQNDYDSEPRCKVCGRKVSFISLSQGYHKLGYYDSDKEYFCCNKCQRIYHEKANKESLNSEKSRLERARTQFLSYGSPEDVCYLYVTWIVGFKLVKYGVATNVLTRHDYSRMNHKYYNTHILLAADRVSIANIEYEIKTHFNSEEYLESSKLDELFLVIKKVLNDYRKAARS